MQATPNDMSQIRVMLVDDSAVVRGLIARALKEDPLFNVVASAANGAMALQILKHEKIDVVLLDIEMPEMDGLTALPLIIQANPTIKVIMVSTLSERGAEISLRALSLGAVDYVPKPSSRQDAKVTDDFYREIRDKIKAVTSKRGAVFSPASNAHVPKTPSITPEVQEKPVAPVAVAAVQKPASNAPALAPSTGQHPVHAIAIGSSTGGPQALLQLFGAIKTALPNIPIFVTQHMPPTFTTILADHIARASGKSCHEAKQGQSIEPGHIYIAPGDFHMVIESDISKPRIALNQNPPINFCRPSVDPMLDSLAKLYGKNLLVAILTGMGHDGLNGCKNVVSAGGTVIAQDEASCVVYGMPKAVADNKLCKAILPLNEIAPYILKSVEGK